MAYPNKAADDFLRRPLTAAPMQSARRVPSAAELQADAERYVASRQAKPENLSYRTGEASAPFKQTPQPTNPSYRPAPASAPAPVTAPAVNNTFFSTGSSASRATTDKMGKVRQIVNGVYEAPKSGPGVISRTAGAIKSGAGRVADGVKAASVGRTEGSAAARLAEAAKAGYSAATAARPAAAAVEAVPAAAKASLTRRALGGAATGLGRTGAFVGRALTPAMAAYGAYKSGTMSGEDRAQFNNELGVTDSNTLGGDLANNTANTAFNIGNALTGGYAEKLGQGIGSAMGGGSFKEGWGGKTFEERTSKPDSSNAVGGMQSDTTKTPESKRDSLQRRTSAANEKLEQVRQRYAAQAPGIGSVDLGAGNLNTDGFGNATNQTGMVGGGMKRNSLASSIGKFGEPVYDNDSIARMMARDAGKGGWNAKNLDRVEEATRITNRNAGGEGFYAAPQGPTAVGAAAARGESGASSRRSAGGGTGGIDGYGGDNGSFRQPRFPQAQITQGNLMGANSERKAGIANLDVAIKSLTTENGGLNMRSKRSLYGDLLRQRAEMSGKPYEVENARDMKGADQANEMAKANADRALEQDKFGFEREKYATTRADAAAAAYAKANGPLSAEDQLKNLELEEKIASMRAGYNGAMNADDRGYLKDLTAELAKDGKMSAEDARAQATEMLVDERVNSGQKLDNQTLINAGKTRLDKINDEVNSDRGWWKGAWQGDIAGNDAKIDLNSYDPDQINIQKQPWNASPQSALNKLNPFTDPLYEAVGPMQKSDSGAEQRYKRVISGEKEASEFQKQLNRAAATRRAMRRDDK